MKTVIIAEAGVNHNGDIEIAKKMIDVAKNAGVDIIKFQTFKAENIASSTAKKANYQVENTGNSDDSQLSMLKKLELSKEEHRTLYRYCSEKGIDYLSTPFDIQSIDILNEMNIDTIKIASGEITNYPYLDYISKMDKNIILSTGMSTMEDIEAAMNVLNAKEITLLHCNTEYPTPMCDVNLNAMLSLKERFGVPVGYSDHTKGIEVSIAAVALGATVIEKHFTLDRNMEGPDHKASLEPDELTKMVEAIRNIEVAMGSEEKKPSPSEMKNIEKARKSIVAKCSIKKGELYTEDNITTKRPGSGISPMQWKDIIGQKAIRDFEKDELIEK